ncbi:hypothetical protein PG993_001911 [Apiospora rasikravindrae]|uniref:Uncharacterized protein n=1 Tax=Apiospora rasikravindrae TaxID=990691 RepID=A0ABR1UCS0_9PEZI
MPGLTLNTDGTGIPQTPVPVPVPNIAGYAPPTTNNSGTTTARSAPSAPSAPIGTISGQPAANNAATKSPVPIPTVPQRAPPAATTPVARATQSTAPSSPPRPPVSPITPPLNPVQFPPPRQSHAYSSHPAQTVVAPPPPEPIEFDTNPDVLALKSAISILQMQSNNAKKDMVALQKAKDAALEDPDAFIADLENGGVRMAGDTAGAGRPGSSSSSSGADDDTQIKDENDETTTKRESKPWSTLPAAQNVYRCPPINWSQYAVTGESLDRLHNEQLARPSQGAPATVAPDGRYEFKGAGKQEELVGVAAPYNPLRDKIERKKPKGPPR